MFEINCIFHMTWDKSFFLSQDIVLKIYTESRSNWTSSRQSNPLRITAHRTHFGWRISNPQAVGHGQNVPGKHRRVHAPFPHPSLDTRDWSQPEKGEVDSLPKPVQASYEAWQKASSAHKPHAWAGESRLQYVHVRLLKVFSSRKPT